MNDTIFWRMVWKEYRTQRGFWIGVAGFAVVSFLIVLMTIDRADERTSALYAIAMIMPAFYALGCGAVLFAAEKEDGTFGLLRQLPLATWG